MKHVFIIKPNDSALSMETDVASMMAGCDYITRYVCYAGHAKKIAKDYVNEKNRIYIVGGDGLIHEVCQALVGSENEIVVIPAGTGNDFSRLLSKKRKPLEILEKSLEKEATKIDVIKCNDIYCINSFCFGFDSFIANHVHDKKAIKFLPKSLNYTTVLASKLSELHSYRTKLYYNEDIVFSGDLLVGGLMNGKYYGGGYKVNPAGSLTDGYLDVCLVPDLKKSEIAPALALFRSGHIDKVKRYYHRQLSCIDVESYDDVNIDGEMYPKGTYHLEVVPKALNIVLID